MSSITTAQPNANVIVRAHGGTAVCDWFRDMRQDEALGADVVVLEFTGNVFTSCMVDRADSRTELVASYRDDAARAVGIIHSGQPQAQVVLVATPPAALRPLKSGPHPLDAAYRAVAASHDLVTFDRTPERVFAGTDRTGGSGLAVPGLDALPQQRGRSIRVRRRAHRGACRRRHPLLSGSRARERSLPWLFVGCRPLRRQAVASATLAALVGERSVTDPIRLSTAAANRSAAPDTVATK